MWSFASHVHKHLPDLFAYIHIGIPVLLDVLIDKSLENSGSICITCIFINGTQLTNASCLIDATEMGGFFTIAVAFKDQWSSNGSACIMNLATGVYTIIVCEVNSKSGSCSNEKVFVYNNITVVGSDIGNGPCKLFSLTIVHCHKHTCLFVTLYCWIAFMHRTVSHIQLFGFPINSPFCRRAYYIHIHHWFFWCCF